MDAGLAERFRQAVPAGGFLLVTLCQGALRVPRRTSRCRSALCDVRGQWCHADGLCWRWHGVCRDERLSLSGLRRAAEQAHDWARLSARQSVVDFAQLIVAPPHGEYSSVERQPWPSVAVV